MIFEFRLKWQEMKPFFNSQSNMAFFGFDQSVSFPTASQGNDDSGNEIAKAETDLWNILYILKSPFLWYAVTFHPLPSLICLSRKFKDCSVLTRLRAWLHVQLHPERKFYCNCMMNFSPGAKHIWCAFSRSLFRRLRFYFDYMVFLRIFQLGLKPSPFNRHFCFKKISFRNRAEFSPFIWNCEIKSAYCIVVLKERNTNFLFLILFMKQYPNVNKVIVRGNLGSHS